MTYQKLAIASCRVSSDEQLKNRSLERQRDAVTGAALKLGVTIPKDAWWSGSVSSKRGKNIKRKDIAEMIEYCKKNKAVKYLIVDEPDRFMRSTKEAMYFEQVFELIGVKIWYASDDDLNSDNMSGKLMKFMKYFVAEGSNEERQSKSIDGLTKSLRLGYWPFQPKAGYKPGVIKGIPEIDSTRGYILRDCLLDIIEYRKTPSEALAALNATKFVKNGVKYKMDKFRKICTDPFYAGVVEMNKQVTIRNENGQHEPLISMAQHLKLVEIFDTKKKTQSGPRKNGNPDYPLSNIVHCESCKDERYGRYVGFKVNNGKNKSKVYHKYRCRSCGAYFSRDDLNQKIIDTLRSSRMTEEGKNELLKALQKVWGDRRRNAAQEKLNMAADIRKLEDIIDSRVEAAIDPTNSSIKDAILRKINDEREMLESLREKLARFDQNHDADRERFLSFALERAENMEQHFLSLPKDRLLQCKQMLFPSGFWVDTNQEVYTPEISIIYRLASNKKDLPGPEKSSMVRVRRL
ncbi:recombinase family protein [Candidatus Saccharibacteria bacterium]|nr:recombinase family protein [Candidatus Saccharibacteria bacterium]